MPALNRNGWSVFWIDLLELAGLKMSSLVSNMAFDQVNVAVACKPCEKRLLPLTCKESYHVFPVGEPVTVTDENWGYGRSALSKVLVAGYPAYGAMTPTFEVTGALLIA